MTTQVRTIPMPTIDMPSERAWAAQVLLEEQLELSEARRVQHYGRRKLGTGIRIVLWLLRIYVVLMMIIIGVQLWIGVHQ